MKIRNFLISLLTLLASGFVNICQAQHIKIQNNPKYDRQVMRFGFYLGFNVANFKIDKSEDFHALDSLYIIDNVKQTGFSLGIVSDLKMGEHFDLRFIPALLFGQRDLDYTFYANNKFEKKVTKQIESTFVELPLSIKFKSDRINNCRGYFIAGGQYMIDMVSQAKVQNKDKQYVKLDKFDYGYHIGAGFDFYMDMFKLSMELKMYHGINNMLVPDPSIYSSSISSLRSKIFYISFYFE